jgi:hypothetical protein
MVSLEALQARLWETKPLLRHITYSRMMTRFREALVASRRGEHATAARAAADLYRLVIRESPVGAEELLPRTRLLNYTGLKLVALSRQSAPNWDALQGASGEAIIHALFLQRRHQAAGIDEALSRILAALSKAIRHRDLANVEEAGRRLQVIALRLLGAGAN